jgi:cardiolipin synthase
MLTSGQLARCITPRSFFLHARSRSVTFSLQSVHRFQHTQSQTPAPRENIYTFPNLLTLSRIVACPALGWAILSDNYAAATGLLLYAGITDWVSSRDSSPPHILMTRCVPA